MRKFYKMGRILMTFLPAIYFAGLLYRDLFIHTGNNVLFLVVGFPSLHLIIISMQLITMLTGRQYQKFEEISAVKTYFMPIWRFFPNQIRFSRFFFAIKINDRDRIVSGVFWQYPSSIVVYKDAFDKLKIFSQAGLLIKFLWIVANLAVLAVLKFFIL